MTWLKLSDNFAEECADADLSDAAFRTHIEGLLWVMRRESGGRIKAREIDRLAESEHVAEAVQELAAAGFWLPTPDGYLVVHHMEHQPEADLIRQRRAATAERQRRLRRKKAGLDDGAEPNQDSKSRRDKTRDREHDETRDPERSGAGRNGKQPKSFTEKEELEGREDWPPVAAPGAWADDLYERD